MLRIMKLVIIILNISYFLGFAWYIIGDLETEFVNYRVSNSFVEMSILNHYEWKVPQNLENFVSVYEMPYKQDSSLTDEENERKEDQKDLVNGLKVVYFAFTSLSTIGFGDFHPKSDFERLLCALILLFGVAIFSYIMGIFINILDKYQNLNADLDEGDKLSKFFGVIKFFNDNVMINQDLKERIEQHFEFKW